jgi:hypothetical protein
LKHLEPQELKPTKKTIKSIDDKIEFLHQKVIELECLFDEDRIAFIQFKYPNLKIKIVKNKYDIPAQLPVSGYFKQNISPKLAKMMVEADPQKYITSAILHYMKLQLEVEIQFLEGLYKELSDKFYNKFLNGFQTFNFDREKYTEYLKSQIFEVKIIYLKWLRKELDILFFNDPLEASKRDFKDLKGVKLIPNSKSDFLDIGNYNNNKKMIDRYLNYWEKQLVQPPKKVKKHVFPSSAVIKKSQTSHKEKNIFKFELDTWKIVFDGKEIPLKQDYMGLKYLHVLVNNKGREYKIYELINLVEQKEVSSNQELNHEAIIQKTKEGWEDDERMTISTGDNYEETLDQKAVTDYKERLTELSEERRAAELKGDFNKIASINNEFQFIKKQLNGIRTLDGRRVMWSKNLKNAINRVKENVRRIYKKLEGKDDYEEFYLHLKNSVKISKNCWYKPDREIDWHTK